MSARGARRTAGALAAAALCLVPLAHAQSTDEQTQDYEQQDRRYYERYRQDDEQRDRAPDDRSAAEAFLKRAEELVHDHNYWSRGGDHYVVETDDPALDSKAALDLLEGFRSFFDAFWRGRIELRPRDEVSRVFLFDSFYKYNELLGFDARRMDVRPRGHYALPYDVLVVHTRADTPASFADSLVHEAAHQLIERRIYGADSAGRASPWISEGLASYFGFTYRDAAGVFQAGRIGGKSIALLRGAPTGGHEEAARLKRFRRSLRTLTSEPGFLERLVSVNDPARFYGGDVEVNYSASWLLVHYLLHGDDGAHARAFARYLSAETRGQGGPEALHRELGMDAAALETAFVEYVRKL